MLRKDAAYWKDVYLSACGVTGRLNGKPTFFSKNVGSIQERYAKDNILKYKDSIDLSMFSIDEEYYPMKEFLEFDYKSNNYGFRDNIDYTADNSPDEIWCFGCSYTEGLGVPMHRTWPKIIEQKTGFRTKNFGVAAGGLPTISRLIYQWLEFSKYPPKQIFVLGYFTTRTEILLQRGEWLRIVPNQRPRQTRFLPIDKKNVDEQINYVNKSYDEFVANHLLMIESTVKDIPFYQHDILQYYSGDFDIGRDLKFNMFDNAVTINDLDPKLYEKRFCKLMLDKDMNVANLHKHFGTVWTTHSGPKYHEHVADQMLKNLTI